MDIMVSLTANVDTVSKLGFDEGYIEQLLRQVVDMVFDNPYVEANSQLAVAAKTKYDMAEIDLYLCDNDEIRKLNKEYRNIDSVTDVLSFSLQETFNLIDIPILNLGEIIISVDKLKEQAAFNSHSDLHELIFLISHGVLHLLGINHDTQEAYEKVISVQDEVVNKLATSVIG